jgi:serine/threonine protein kinase
LIRGEVADQRADIYSLGVTLYEMLSGRPPFVADSAMTLMMMHLNDPVPNVRSFRQDVPAELARILERCLAKDRSQRYQSAAELAADLRAALPGAGQATMVSPPVVPTSETVASRMDPMPAPVGLTASSPSLVSSTPASAAAVKKEKTRGSFLLPGLIGGALFIIACLGITMLFGRAMFSGLGSATPTATETAPAPTETTPPTVELAPIVLATETLAPSETPTEAPTATETMPPLFVRINSITVNDTGNYVVEYETFGYTEQLPGMHVHFFFNTVPVEQAGSPGSGPWYLYGGPRPFTKYKETDRPADATEMCALVANSNHSIIPESGNCMNLP